jgi:hypothetical protein
VGASLKAPKLHKQETSSGSAGMNLEQKIEETSEFLRFELGRYKNPCAMISFGKDSMVLLWLLRRIGIIPPIVFYTDPWFPKKYRFARDLIADLGLTIFDYPPLTVSMLYGRGIPAFVNEYQTSSVTTVAVPKNIVEYKEGVDSAEYLCGVNFFTRPLGAFNFPWDAAFVAHKDCDEDQIYGPVPLQTRVLYRDAGPDYLYPLKEWGHDDVWDYIERFSVPMQLDRYNVALRREHPHKTFNSDYWPACIRCVDKRLAGSQVFCPKMQRKIENVSAQVREFDWIPDYFGEVKNGT